MRLYATVTSERATKGQGGNTQLEIKLYGLEGKHLATVFLFPDMGSEEECMLHVRTPDNQLMFGHILPLDTEKGNKQKGKCKAILTASNHESGNCPLAPIKGGEYCELHKHLQ